MWWLSFTVQSSFLILVILVKFYFGTSITGSRTRTQHPGTWLICKTHSISRMTDAFVTSFVNYIYLDDARGWRKASWDHVYLCSVKIVSGPSSCLSEAFNGSSSWPSTDANPTEWQSLSNRVFPPLSILFHRTDSHSESVQKQHCWNWYPISMTLLPIIICPSAEVTLNSSPNCFVSLPYSLWTEN